MTLPNFVIIGGTKAGTTSIYRYLEQHPQIFVCNPKEPKFFAFEDSPPTYSGPVSSVFNDQTITTLHEYKQLFDAVDGERSVGEGSQVYMYFPRASERIQHHIPHAKLLVFLRNPADRAFSFFKMQCHNGLETTRDFRTALENESRRMTDNWGPPWYYRDRGYYCRQLKVYFDMFDREQLKVVLYEDIKTDIAAVLADILRFLEVDEMPLNTAKQHNVTSRVVRNRKLDHLLLQENAVKKITRLFLPKGFRRSVRKRVDQWNRLEITFDSDLRHELVEGYGDDILALQDLIHRDLSHWMS